MTADDLAVARLLRDVLEGQGLVFAMVQKYQERDDGGAGAGEGIDLDSADTFPLLNDSEDVLVLVDEAHRSHTKSYHANMQQALPNAARVVDFWRNAHAQETTRKWGCGSSTPTTWSASTASGPWRTGFWS